MAKFEPYCNLPQTEAFGPAMSNAEVEKACLHDLSDFPFEPCLEPGNLGRVCDFTFRTYQRHLREVSKWSYPLPAGLEEEMEFQTVHSRPSVKSKPGHYRDNRNLKETAQAYLQKQQQEMALKLGRKTRSDQKKQKAAQQAKFQRISARQRTFTEWSIEPEASWVLEADIPLTQLQKLSLPSNKVLAVDLGWKGKLRYYDKQIEKIGFKKGVPLVTPKVEFNHYNVTAQDDDFIKLRMIDPETAVTVAATDLVLACLITAVQSRYSWHLVITKIEEKLFLDKPEQSILDILTVNETALEPPMQDAEIKANRPPDLGWEALKINRNFREQVLSGNTAVKYETPTFVQNGETAAPIAYRYRKFTLPGRPDHATAFGRQPVSMICRTEIHAKMPDAENDIEGNVSIFALNEYDIKSSKSWRSQISTQTGALLATEVRNNNNKLQRFIASAMLAGCQDIKIGYVTRNHQPNNHLILSVQNYKTSELCMQIGPKPDNAWGIVRGLIDVIMDKPDGTYILLKDPMKPAIKLFSIPEDFVNQ